VKKEYKIPKNHVACLGDLINNHSANIYKKSPDVWYSGVGEIKLIRDRVKEWTRILPELILIKGNHDDWWMKKANDEGYPTMTQVPFETLFKIPETWYCMDRHILKDLDIGPLALEHGTEFSGEVCLMNAVRENNMHTAIGHIHTRLGYRYYRTKHGLRLGINCASLLNPDDPIFVKQEKRNRLKSVQGVTVLIDGGRRIECLPLE